MIQEFKITVIHPAWYNIWRLASGYKYRFGFPKKFAFEESPNFGYMAKLM